MESNNQLKRKYREYKDVIYETKLDMDRLRERTSELEKETREYKDVIQKNESEINMIREQISKLETYTRECIFLKEMYSDQLQQRQITRQGKNTSEQLSVKSGDIEINEAEKIWYNNLLSDEVNINKTDKVKKDTGLKRKKKSRSKRKRSKRKYNKKFT